MSGQLLALVSLGLTGFSRLRRGGEEDYLLGIDPLFPSRLALILVASTILQYPVALLILY
jgi:hypothetical protein